MAIRCLNSTSVLVSVTVTSVSPYTIVSQNCFRLGSFLSISFRLGNCTSIPASTWTKVATIPLTISSQLHTGCIGYRTAGYEPFSARYDTDGSINVWSGNTGYSEIYFWASLLIS